jgi:hypothetical protein
MSTRMRWLLPAVLGAAWLLSPGSMLAQESALLGRTNPLAQLFPSATARAERERAAWEAKLEQALLRLPGVIDAQATLTLAAADAVPLDQPLPAPRAAIVVRVRPDRYDDAQAQALAQGLLPPGSQLQLQPLPAEGAPEAQRMRSAAEGQVGQTKRVGPFHVARSSADPLRATLAALLVSNALLALLLLRKARVRPR